MRNMMKSLLFGSSSVSSPVGDALVTAARMIFGFSMAFAHGLPKMPPPDQLMMGVEAMGFPAPAVFAWAAALSEFLGGIFLGLGLFTRASAFFLAITMAVAVLVAHGADPFAKKEMALLYFSGCLVFLGLGSGRIGIDRFFRKG